MLSSAPMERRLQIAGVLLLLGLLVEAFFLFWTRPIGFVLFVGIGGFLVGVGILVYLLSLLTRDQSETTRRSS